MIKVSVHGAEGQMGRMVTEVITSSDDKKILISES